MLFADPLSSTTLYPAAALGLAFICYAWTRNSALHKIPTVGPSGIFISRIGAIQSFLYGHQMMKEGYEKYSIFKIAVFFSWLVVVSGPEHIEDIRKATNDQMTFFDALDKTFQFDYTISPRLRLDLFHNNAVRGPMTRSIGTRFPEIFDEISKALGDLIKTDDNNWIPITCWSTARHVISRLSARFFVGPDLSSDPDYTKSMQEYINHIIQTAVILRLLPDFLKSAVSNTLFDSEKRIRAVEEYLRPILTKRLEKRMIENVDEDPASNDMVTWLWHAAPEDHRTLRDLTMRMTFLNIAAIHTTSKLLAQVLFNLATYTSYIEPLREEISTIIDAEGWNKVSLEKMRKLDSFVKESQRLHGTEATTVIRLTTGNFTFSDGTFIPKGTDVAIAGRAMNMDEQHYPNPHEFQGFRFAGKDPFKWQVSSLNPEFLSFGIGRHACPGRFFAATEIKAVVVHLLLGYDIKLTDEEGGRPKDVWDMGVFIVPDQNAKISLRKR